MQHVFTGRIICGWISDKPWADSLKIYNAALIIGGSATVACAWFSSYALQATYAGVFGLSVGE
jgi:sugar phosphate permease